ncbi:helix-turn-helix transcriptional regulator [Tahibacter harae]|uniref:Helix-turn-helix transcriptional regulator n=1 Tax=Tahibacter harae TaxID=2963937 RepID=A0ABT1QY79_9GAMM|nr:helix-turn-helix transcriptional regulator [Tahibacter harae]MCQ4167210.1 helix-turn-helix transcriptional regulator [Tahibacter harae]
MTAVSDPAALLPVIDRIYAAAAREVPLDEAFQAFAELMGDFVAALFVHDPVPGGAVMESAAGLDRHWPGEYNRRWSSRTPLLQRGLGELMAGRIVSSEDIMPWDELVETDYYREFYAPLGCRYSLGVLVAGDGRRYASLVTARGERAGPYQARHRALIAAVRSHLGRALHMLEFFEGATLSLDLFRQAMDQLPFPVLLLDDQRRVVYANQRAAARLQQGDGIVESRGRLSASGAERDSFEQGWNQLVQDALAAEGRFRIRGSGDPVPLRLEATRIGVSGATAAGGRLWLLRLCEGTFSRRQLALDWRTRFGLTGSECRVGTALLEHGDAVSVAAALGMAENTVRAHLKNMFAKTATRSQAALVLRLAMEGRLVD